MFMLDGWIESLGLRSPPYPLSPVQMTEDEIAVLRVVLFSGSVVDLAPPIRRKAGPLCWPSEYIVLFVNMF